MSDAAASRGAGASSALETLEREQAGEAPGGVAERARAGGRHEGPDPQELGQFLDALDQYNPTVRACGCVFCLRVGSWARMPRRGLAWI